MIRSSLLPGLLLALVAHGCSQSSSGVNAPTDQVSGDSFADSSLDSSSETVALDLADSQGPADTADGLMDSQSDVADIATDLHDVPSLDLDGHEPEISDIIGELGDLDMLDQWDDTQEISDLSMPDGMDAGLDGSDGDSEDTEPGDVEPEVVEPQCLGYEQLGGTVCRSGPTGKVPGVRLMFSLTGASDSSVCGSVSWKLGNRVLLQGTTPDGMARGRLTGAQVFYDYDEQFEDDVYSDAHGGPASYPFVIELLDQEQNVVWRGRRREPLQVREYIFGALEANTGIAPANWMVPLVAGTIGADFEAYTTVIPDLPQARYLRFWREWSLEEKATITSCDTSTPLVLPTQVHPSGPLQKLIDLDDIATVPISLFTDTVGTWQVKKIFGNAPARNSVNMVILADGYTADRLETFQADAQTVADFLASLEPFASFVQRLNIWTVWTPSAEPGASFDCGCNFYDTDAQNCTTPHDGCVDGLRDNVYGSVFAVRALYKVNPLGTGAPSLSADRNLFPIYLFRVGMAMSLSADDGTPISGDAAFILTDDEKRGAFGLFNASLTTWYRNVSTEEFAEVATHEMGHAFGLLGDEYSTSTDVCQLFELTPLFPNFSPIVSSAQELPWAPWATLDAPYPHDESQGSASDVGCYVPPPGGGICVDSLNQPALCRPSKTCKMKTNSGEFCPVCRDHIVHRIFNTIDIIDSDEFYIEESGTGLLFSVQTSFEPTNAVWRVDGELMHEGALAPFLVDPATLAPGEHKVSLTVSYTTELSRVWTSALTETMEATLLVQ